MAALANYPQVSSERHGQAEEVSIQVDRRDWCSNPLAAGCWQPAATRSPLCLCAWLPQVDEATGLAKLIAPHWHWVNPPRSAMACMYWTSGPFPLWSPCALVSAGACHGGRSGAGSPLRRQGPRTGQPEHASV